MKKIILLTLLFSVLTACKNEKSEPKPNQFEVTLSVHCNQEQDVILYYKDGSNEWFDEAHTVWNHLKPNANSTTQELHFLLPEGVLPTDFRFDFGRNDYKENLNWTFSKLQFHYKDRDFVVMPHQFATYLRGNASISKLDEKGNFTTQKDNQNYDPFFECTEAFYPIIMQVATSL